MFVFQVANGCQAASISDELSIAKQDAKQLSENSAPKSCINYCGYNICCNLSELEIAARDDAVVEPNKQLLDILAPRSCINYCGYQLCCQK
jgi:hypothetical protein